MHCNSIVIGAFELNLESNHRSFPRINSHEDQYQCSRVKTQRPDESRCPKRKMKGKRPLIIEWPKKVINRLFTIQWSDPIFKAVHELPPTSFDRLWRLRCVMDLHLGEACSPADVMISEFEASSDQTDGVCHRN